MKALILFLLIFSLRGQTFPPVVNPSSITLTGGAQGTANANTLRDIPSVKDAAFAAIGNGIADDKPAFQLACTSVASGVIQILVPRGIYLLNSSPVCTGRTVTWVLSADAVLIGAGVLPSPVGKSCFGGSTSGQACITVPAIAGTPNDVLLPNATGAANSFLQTDGANPQQTTWAAISVGYPMYFSDGSGLGAGRWFGLGVLHNNAVDTGLDVPAPGVGITTAKNLYCTISTAPGAGTSWIFTASINASDSTLTCTIANSAKTCNDTTHTPAITQGQSVTIHTTASGSPAASTFATCTLTVQ